MADATKKTPPDWERIEAHYRAGVMSIREIARADGNVTEAAIRQKAKTIGWERDLGAKIAARAEALLRKKQLRTDASQQGAKPLANEREVVEVNAQAIADVRLAHRGDIRRARALAMRMLTELEQVTDRPELAHELAEALADPGEEGDPDLAKKRQRRLQDLLEQVTGLPGRIAAVKQLADSMKTLIGLEREAWNLDNDTDPGDGGAGRTLTDLERAARLASIIDRARRRAEAGETPSP